LSYNVTKVIQVVETSKIQVNFRGYGNVFAFCLWRKNTKNFKNDLISL